MTATLRSEPAAAEPIAKAADARKRVVDSCSSAGDDGSKRLKHEADPDAAQPDDSLVCAAADEDDDMDGRAQHLGSVRVWIMETHPRHCHQSPWSFCYARCRPIKALLTKGAAKIRAVRDEHGIAIHINGAPAAAFDREREAAFVAAMDTGQVIFDSGVAASWAEIDFDVLAGPANPTAAVPPGVQACEGFEEGVHARDRTCDGNDCGCC